MKKILLIALVIFILATALSIKDEMEKPIIL